MVRTHYQSNKSKFAKKFAYRYKGPYRVISITSPVTYELDIPDSNYRVQNVKNLKKYFDRPAMCDSCNVELPAEEQNLGRTESQPPILSPVSSRAASPIVPSHNYNLRSKVNNFFPDSLSEHEFVV